MKLVLLFALILIPTVQVDSWTPGLSCPMAAKNASISMNAPDLIYCPVHQRGRQTQTAIPASNAAMTIRDFTFRIVGVVFDKTALGLVPMDIAESDQVMFVEFELLSGNRESFRSLQIPVTSPSGRKLNPIIVASNGVIKTLSAVTIKDISSDYQPGKNNIAWAYVVPKGMNELYLNFPAGEVVDLSPLIKRFD
jgi:hypothetical protein